MAPVVQRVDRTIYWMSQYVLLVFIHWIPLHKLWTTQAWTSVYMEVNHFDVINFKAKLESRRKGRQYTFS